MPISDDVTMFYGAKPEIFDKAATLRNNMTEAETILWEKLKDRNLFPSKFRRQHPVDIFIVDFFVTMQNWSVNLLESILWIRIRLNMIQPEAPKLKTGG